MLFTVYINAEMKEKRSQSWEDLQIERGPLPHTRTHARTHAYMNYRG